jgi:hypothetical protein
MSSGMSRSLRMVKSYRRFGSLTELFLDRWSVNMEEIRSLFITGHGVTHPEYLNLHQQCCEDYNVSYNLISLCTFMVLHSATSFRLAKDTLRKEAVCNLTQ